VRAALTIEEDGDQTDRHQAPRRLVRQIDARCDCVESVAMFSIANVFRKITGKGSMPALFADRYIEIDKTHL
jgi:hypothetical protein